MGATKILVFAGSARREALSKRLARAAHAALLATGAQATLIDLADYPAPVYNGDDETASGVPPGITALLKVIIEHDGILIATPEYNGSMTPLLVNTLDWLSRINASPAGPAGLAVLPTKPVAIISSSPGPLGGIRSLFHLRDLLGYLGMLVLPQQLAVGRANEAISPEGVLLEERQRGTLQRVARALVDTVTKLKA